MASENILEIRIIRMFQKVRTAIPADICRAMKIKKGNNLVTVAKGNRIVFEKQEDVVIG